MEKREAGPGPDEGEAHYRALFDAMASAMVEEDFSGVKARLDAMRARGVEDIGAYLDAHPEELRACVGMIRILRFNEDFVEYLNLPDKASVQPSLLAYIPDQTMGVFRDEIAALAGGASSVDISFPNMIPGSRAKHVRMRLRIVAGHESDWSSVLVSFVDLTSEVEARDELAGLVRQKDVLMRELEHRVKNNLNIISSLLSLESAQVETPSQRKILLDAQSRIKSIALIYDLLSRSAQGATLNCKSYIESLAPLLRETYGGDRQDIELRLAVDDFDIDVKRGVSIGLVATELLTNAFKYAFPGRGGRVDVSISADRERIVLVVSDDGVGLPEGQDPASASSLGFQLIGLLVQQMRGGMRSASAGGFRVEIELPRDA